MIELLFKQIKQNFPLRYFWGESLNSIKIQIYCVLIAQLLMVVIRKKSVTKKSFSNMITLIRLHLMSYINLINKSNSLLSVSESKSLKWNVWYHESILWDYSPHYKFGLATCLHLQIFHLFLFYFFFSNNLIVYIKDFIILKNFIASNFLLQSSL